MDLNCLNLQPAINSGLWVEIFPYAQSFGANLNDFLGNEAFSHHYAIYGQNQIKICRAAKRAD